MSLQYKYDAFISYRRSDGKEAAAWLRRYLQRYSLPRAFRSQTTSPYPENLKLYLDTEYERATGDFYENTIKPSLLKAKHLIVLLTPAALATDTDDGENWMAREYRDFRDANQNGDILIVLAKGDDHPGPIPKFVKSDFPNPEVVDLRFFGSPLPAKRSYTHREIEKLIQPLYGIPLEEMPLLRQEEERLRSLRHAKWAVALFFLVLALAALSTWALFERQEARQHERNAVEQKRDADRQRKRAEQREREARESLSQSYFLQAVEKRNEDDLHRSLAYLARSLETSPDHRGAKELLFYTLSQYPWPVLAVPPMSHEARINHIRFSHNGKMVATASVDGVVKRWNADGEAIAKPLTHPASLDSMVFSMDDRLLLTACRDGNARLWDWRAGKIATPLMQQGPRIYSAVISPDGRYIATVDTKAVTKLWQADTGHLIARFVDDTVEGFRFNIFTPVFSEDSQKLATVYGDDTLRFWESATGKPISTALRYGQSTRSTVVAENGNTALSTYDGGIQVLWDPRDGRVLMSGSTREKELTSNHSKNGLLSAHMEGETLTISSEVDGSPVCPPFVSDRESPAVSFGDDSLIVYARTDGNKLYSWGIGTCSNATTPQVGVDLIASSKDGDKRLTSAGDTAYLWYARSFAALHESYYHSSSINNFALSPNGEQVATGTEDNRLKIWSRKQTQQPRFEIRHRAPVVDLSYSKDGSLLATAAKDEVRVFDTAKGTLVGEPLKHPANLSSVQFCDDTRRILAVFGEGATLWVRGAATAVYNIDLHPSTPRDPTLGVAYATFSPDCKWIGTISSKRSVDVWRAKDGSHVKWNSFPVPDADHIVFHPKAERLLHGHSTGQVQMMEIVSGKNVYNGDKPDAIRGLGFSDDGKFFWVSFGTVAALHETNTGNLMTDELIHSSPVIQAAFNSHGTLFGTGAGDGTVRLWDVTTGRLVAGPVQHGSNITGLAFSENDQALVVSGGNGLLTFLNLAPKRAFPKELVPFVEAVANSRYKPNGSLEFVQSSALAEISAQLPDTNNDPWFLLAKWLVAPPEDRTIAPGDDRTPHEWFESIFESDRDVSRVALQHAFNLAVSLKDKKMLERLNTLSVQLSH